VRPTSGLEIVSSRHFPDEVQGDIILANAIGFLGIKQHKIEDDSTGWKTSFRQDLLVSKDGNFRPVDLEFAPDGSLYVIDWHNVLIGHMQHNARDPLRDHVHGRIYRITYPSRPLVKPVQVEGAPVAALLENLKEPELRVRYRTRRELRSHPVSEVFPAVKAWAAKQTDVHAKLEALWVTWGMNQVDDGLLREMLALQTFHARAAAVRVLRYNHHVIADHAALLEKAAADEHGRVRLEAIVAASWLPDTNAGKKIVAIASSKPLDVWSQNAAKTAADRLAGIAEVEKPEFAEIKAPAHLSAEAKAQFMVGQKIYFREGHCVTCHQPNGKGLDPAFPSIEKSPWVTGDTDRLIKIRHVRPHGKDRSEWQKIRRPSADDALRRYAEGRRDGCRAHLCAQHFRQSSRPCEASSGHRQNPRSQSRSHDVLQLGRAAQGASDEVAKQQRRPAPQQGGGGGYQRSAPPQQRPPQRPAPAQQDDFGEGPITDGLEGDDIPF
jgi:mono/diheme cytochrome c family protein